MVTTTLFPMCTIEGDKRLVSQIKKTPPIYVFIDVTSAEFSVSQERPGRSLSRLPTTGVHYIVPFRLCLLRYFELCCSRFKSCRRSAFGGLFRPNSFGFGRGFCVFGKLGQANHYKKKGLI